METRRVGDEGLLALTYNRSWENLQKLSIYECGIESLTLNVLKRNRYWRNFRVLTSEECTEQMTKSKFGKKWVLVAVPNPSNMIPWKLIRRGGSGSKKNSTSELSSKINQYKEKVKNNKCLDKEMNIFMETRARDSLLEDLDDKNTETFELDFKIRKALLDVDSPAKVLLITGGLGIGKTLFCKHLQRSILVKWNPDDQEEEEEEESHEKGWLPVYVNLSTLKNPKSSAVSEALSRELLFTESEIRLFQNQKSNNILPRLLFIFDGYDLI